MPLCSMPWEQEGTVKSWVLDAMRLRYLDAVEWPEVAEEVCYSRDYANRMVTAALSRAESGG